MARVFTGKYIVNTAKRNFRLVAGGPTTYVGPEREQEWDDAIAECLDDHGDIHGEGSEPFWETNLMNMICDEWDAVNEPDDEPEEMRPPVEGESLCLDCLHD